ncbi:hypothetical protein DKX38_029589 [Salix brachista]|uniref:Uncharacterized protein n=1 Tax=Salix brachista TaxID=2182728 RepID=A0A5N5IZP3_9ROSI|nr:hypothetical protein DKX38_029587 [Salix brachista]KAB5512561.1 hypothetical protein DKX38_029589 [Salix brachista]
MLQRIGTGIVLSVITMIIAALVEMKRLETAQEHGLVDLPNATIPMSFWWLIPQYALFGIAESLTMVGLQEVFYDQVPSDLRSVGLSLNLSIFGVGNFLSSFLISLIEKATGGNGRYSWFDNNLNRAHLDYFHWLLAGMSAVQLVSYVYFAKSYIYNRGGYSVMDCCDNSTQLGLVNQVNVKFSCLEELHRAVNVLILKAIVSNYPKYQQTLDMPIAVPSAYN